jgi:hypothetical protein
MKISAKRLLWRQIGHSYMAKRDRNFERAGEVRYSAERPRIPETDEILFDHFFVKSLEWSYEQEAYRHLVVDAADQRIGLRQSQAEQSSPAILTNELPDAEGS